MTNTEKKLAILVGGGPAPGINAVISAATIEARNHGLRVRRSRDNVEIAHCLTAATVAAGHSDIGHAGHR